MNDLQSSNTSELHHSVVLWLVWQRFDSLHLGIHMLKRANDFSIPAHLSATLENCTVLWPVLRSPTTTTTSCSTRKSSWIRSNGRNTTWNSTTVPTFSRTWTAPYPTSKFDSKVFHFPSSTALSVYSLRISFQLQGTESYIQNTVYSTVPLVIHANGPTKLFLNTLGNYIPKGWNSEEGCLTCWEDMKELEKVEVMNMHIEMDRSKDSTRT